MQSGRNVVRKIRKAGLYEVRTPAMRAGVLVFLPHFEGMWSDCSWKLPTPQQALKVTGIGQEAGMRSTGEPDARRACTLKVTGIGQEERMCSTGVPDAQASV